MDLPCLPEAAVYIALVALIVRHFPAFLEDLAHAQQARLAYKRDRDEYRANRSRGSDSA
jgi:hypothetical protein